MYKTIDNSAKITYWLNYEASIKPILITEDNREMMLRLRLDVRNNLIRLGHRAN